LESAALIPNAGTSHMATDGHTLGEIRAVDQLEAEVVPLYPEEFDSYFI